MKHGRDGTIYENTPEPRVRAVLVDHRPSCVAITGASLVRGIGLVELSSMEFAFVTYV
jgi:hypothetical protein